MKIHPSSITVTEGTMHKMEIPPSENTSNSNAVIERMQPQVKVK